VISSHSDYDEEEDHDEVDDFQSCEQDPRGEQQNQAPIG
jgi:hypothetical protein